MPIYAAGKPHPLKAACGQILRLAALNPGAFVTDAEVLQELLHRYRGSEQWEVARARIEDFGTVMRDRVAPLLADDVLTATRLADTHPRLSARDLVHLAVLRRVGAGSIITADADFDAVDGVIRLDPADVARWGAALER